MVAEEQGKCSSRLVGLPCLAIVDPVWVAKGLRSRGILAITWHLDPESEMAAIPHLGWFWVRASLTFNYRTRQRLTVLQCCGDFVSTLAATASSSLRCRILFLNTGPHSICPCILRCLRSPTLQTPQRYFQWQCTLEHTHEAPKVQPPPALHTSPRKTNSPAIPLFRMDARFSTVLSLCRPEATLLRAIAIDRPTIGSLGIHSGEQKA